MERGQQIYTDNGDLSRSIGWFLKKFVSASKISQAAIGLIFGASIGVGLKYFPNALSCIGIENADQLSVKLGTFIQSGGELSVFSAKIPKWSVLLTIPAILFVIKKIGDFGTANAPSDGEATQYFVLKVISTLIIMAVSMSAGIGIAPKLKTDVGLTEFVESVKTINPKEVIQEAVLDTAKKISNAPVVTNK